MALIRELGAAGVSLETMREAAEEDRLALLPVEVALGADYLASRVCEEPVRLFVAAP